MTTKASWIKRSYSGRSIPANDKVMISLAKAHHRASIEDDIRKEIQRVIHEQRPKDNKLTNSESMRSYFGFASLAPLRSLERSFSNKLPPINSYVGSPVLSSTLGNSSPKARSFGITSLKHGRGSRPVARMCHLE